MLTISPQQYYLETMELLYDSTMNIINAIIPFIKNRGLLEVSEFDKFQEQANCDMQRLSDNLEIIKEKIVVDTDK
jgi:hypothetical protein